MPAQGWVTADELAAELRVHKQTITRWVREGKLPDAQRLPGGQLRLPNDAARRLLRPTTHVSARP